MKWLALAVLTVCLYERTVFASWLAETKANQGDSVCPKGQAVGGVIFKNVEETSSSSSSSKSSNSSQSQNSNGDSSSSSSSSSSSQSSVSTFKKISTRVYCNNLDGTTQVHANSTKAGSGGDSRKSFSLKEGCKVTDSDKNCPDGSFISGIKLSDGGDSPQLTIVCSKDDQYELDQSIEPRLIGPIKFGKGQPAQAQNPSKSSADGKCQTDLAVALGCDDGGVTIKVASFKKKGKTYDASCKQKKEEAAKQANSTSSSSTNSSSSSSWSKNETSTSEKSFNSSHSESDMRSSRTSRNDSSSSEGDDCVCVCNQVCHKGGRGGGGGHGGSSPRPGGSSPPPKGSSPPPKGSSPHPPTNNGGGSRHKRSGEHHGHHHRRCGKHQPCTEEDSSSSSSSSSMSERSEKSSHSESSSSSSSTYEESSSSESSSSSSTTTLEYKESTYEGKQVYIVSNEKKLKKCPQSECHCPCVCGHRRGGGGGGQKSGNGGGSHGKGGGSKKGGKSH